MDRITRILGIDNRPRRTSAWRSGIALAAGVLVAAAGIAHAATKDPEPRNPEMLRVLQQIAASTNVDSAELRDLYDMLVFSGSATDLRMDEYLDGVRARIDAGVQSGDITAAEADKKLAAIQRDMAFKADMQFLQDVFMHTPGEAYLVLFENRMEEAVRCGKLTQPQANAKLDAVAKLLSKKAEHSEAVRAKLDAMVQAGEMTREQADAKLKGMSKVQAKKPIDIEAARAKLDAMVQAGQMPREQADAKLKAMSEFQRTAVGD